MGEWIVIDKGMPATPELGTVTPDRPVSFSEALALHRAGVAIARRSEVERVDKQRPEATRLTASQVKDLLARERGEAAADEEGAKVRDQILDLVEAALAEAGDEDPERVAERVRTSAKVQAIRQRRMLDGHEDPATAGSAGFLLRTLNARRQRQTATKATEAERVEKARGVARHVAVRKAHDAAVAAPAGLEAMLAKIALVDSLLDAEAQPLLDALRADGVTRPDLRARELLPGWSAAHRSLVEKAQAGASVRDLEAGHGHRAALVMTLVELAKARGPVADGVRSVLGTGGVLNPY